MGGTRNPRKNNNAFYFKLDNIRVRVCKIFFKNTLDINDRPIRTVLAKRNKIADVLLEDDQRGKHGMQRKVDENIRNGIVQFIDKIPKVESHYTRSNTTRQFIDGSKTISQLHSDYVTDCKVKNIPYDDDYKEAIVIKKKKPVVIEFKPAFIYKPKISERKKADLMDLMKKKKHSFQLQILF
ncbi:unnamed protein product [Psylliodes chrysocephalus]|uniref:Uncharacterized protein n=1 Tax=Psylliodes chrysocephalus TaxID=3402493 RepID=A0A9P0CVW6_9CUCU|nr:unnamed protein product [Psylliodes chrysocephala]